MYETLTHLIQELGRHFPLIDAKSIKIIYDESGTDPLMQFNYETDLSNPKLFKIRSYFYVDESFFIFPLEIQKAIMIHELRHLEIRMEKRNFKKLSRRAQWTRELRSYRDMSIKDLESLSKSEKQRLRKLNKRSVIEEIYADNKAIELGYGLPLLQLLKKEHMEELELLTLYNDKYPFSRVTFPIPIDESEARIANLEQKLGMTE